MEGRITPSVESLRLQEALMRLPITFGMALKTRDQCKEIAESLKDKEHCFVLGKGTTYTWSQQFGLRQRND